MTDRPAADALLIAKYMDRWPNEDEEPARCVYLYRTDALKSAMNDLGYEGLCGIGKPGNRMVSRVVKPLPDEAFVSVCLVFVPDTTVDMPECLGRDVYHHEWRDARKYLDWVEGEDDG